MNLMDVIDQVGREKGIAKEVLIDVVKSAVCSASRKTLKLLNNDIETEFNETTGEIQVFIVKRVVENPVNENLEICLEDALQIDADAKLDQDIKIVQESSGLGRISAQLAKQVIIQKIREAERESIFAAYEDRKGELMSAVVIQFDKGDTILEIDQKAEGLLPKCEQTYRERFRRGEFIKVYLVDVKKKVRGPQIIFSRTHPGLLRALFEIEVPEITEGIIEIKNAVREPNGRSKIAVYSHEKNIDAVGACVGVRGVRVQAVVQELKGEKIDIVEWSEDDAVYVSNALKPAKVSKVNINHEEHRMEVVVAKDQLSLAIGKSGQNVRLAARLSGWKIDIKNEEDLKREVEEQLNTQKEKGSKQALLQVEGVGPELVKLLGEHGIKNIEDLKNAGKKDLLAIPTIGEKKAEKILNFFDAVSDDDKNSKE